MNDIVIKLFDFIDTAEKNRKYPSGTAVGRRAALKLFESELNDDERKSLDSFKKNLEQIYQSVFAKNKSKMAAGSLVTYKSRLLGLIDDFEKYGEDPTKLASWNRPVRKRSTKVQMENYISSKKSKNQNEDPHNTTEVINAGSNSYKFELPLRDGAKAIVSAPSDIMKSEVSKLKKYIEFLESIAFDNYESRIQVDEGK